MGVRHSNEISKLKAYLQSHPIDGDSYEKAAVMNALTEQGDIQIDEVRAYINENGITLSAYIDVLQIDVELETDPSVKRQKAMQKGVLKDFQRRLEESRPIDVQDAGKRAAFESAIDVVAGIMLSMGHAKAGDAKSEIMALADNKRSPAQVIGFGLGAVRAGHIEEALA